MSELETRMIESARDKWDIEDERYKSIGVVFISKYNSPIPLGSQLGFGMGEHAIFHDGGKEDHREKVIINSKMKKHSSAPGNHLVYEVIFEDGSDRFAVYADWLEPVFP